MEEASSDNPVSMDEARMQEHCGPYSLTRYQVLTHDNESVTLHRMGAAPFAPGRGLQPGTDKHPATGTGSRRQRRHHGPGSGLSQAVRDHWVRQEDVPRTGHGLRLPSGLPACGHADRRGGGDLARAQGLAGSTRLIRTAGRRSIQVHFCGSGHGRDENRSYSCSHTDRSDFPPGFDWRRTPFADQASKVRRNDSGMGVTRR